MREVYQEQLGMLTDVLASMSAMVGTAMERATKSLLETDLSLAEQVIDEDALVDEARSRAEEYAFGLLALQAPVAGDLRSVIATIHAAEDMERMGDLALHVAKAARRRHPNAVLPDDVAAYFAEMGRIAVKLAHQVSTVIRTQDVEAARLLDEVDDEMDDLHRHLFTVLMSPDWEHGVATAVDVTLLGRFYERFADHAVAVARRVEFIVTGKMPSR
ncbi:MULTISPECIES: phosphate signaling complex protein PhoU [Saccharopolyspora]|jgi:phosphate transport system protein|uniref:Phosphate-specific transport system accessory protein PhoU n=3 Tax=Saccharopolyspora TaxID=1835 RepID=A0A4R4VX39_9PSEU|nr:MULTISPECIES: phosphate signaling complex protein PhoU [Saccharopolyspora]TDC93645.1 phosphate signaling complex protein PhoU [Saccharopolyspora aridisoli]TDD10632.1 phosphate signaling complex protein PhoU [Saccharopolyspora terrae]TDD92714.1 phosphate signaling complex protein PhoU [Saccharopolyspora karakumensis]